MVDILTDVTRVEAGAATPAGAQTGADLPEYDWDDVLAHDSAGDLWIVFHGDVYDVSEWIHRHPGGAEIFLENFGRDAGGVFDEVGHSVEARAMTSAYRVGTLRAGTQSPDPPPQVSTTLDELHERGPSVRGPGAVQAGPKVRPLPAADASGKRAPGLPDYDWDEIVRHDRPGDFWVVFAGGVFDVSEWIYHHPGGAEVFIKGYGQNLTKDFTKAGHSDDAWAMAQSFRVGNLKRGGTAPAHPGRPRLTSSALQRSRREAAPAEPQALEEIPWAVRWLVPNGERFANFPVINDNDTQLDFYRRFGHIYAVGVPTKKWRLVMVSDPLLLDEVASNAEQFGKRVEEINFFAQLASTRGGGISVVGDSEYYERVRRIMLPWYAPAHQKTQFERMKDVARRMLTAWSTVHDRRAIDMRDWMTRYALEVSGRGACNYDFGLLDPKAEWSAFAKAVPESTKESIARIAEPRPDFTPLPGARRARKKAYRAHNRVLFSTADALVRGRLNTCPMGEQTDLLSRLVTVPDPQTGRHLDPDTIRDQLLMHLSNGMNGPSFIGAWLAYVLDTHREVEERVVAEIDSITGGDPDYDLQYSDLMSLPYMTQVIKETLRIYPPMPVTIRRSLRDGTLGQYRIRKDDIILVGALAAHRDPRYWGPNADAFDPDQFAMEKVVERPRHAFVPFSVGQRQCMAQEVTFMMLRVALFEVYNRYRLRIAPGRTVVKNSVVTTKPVRVPVIREPREPKEERQEALAERRRQKSTSGAAAAAATGDRSWDRPSEISETSAFRHLTIAYGSNFGTSRDLAQRFADRSRVYGFSSDVVNLNDLVEMPAHSQPWLLVVVTATYTGNPPSNSIAFKSWLDAAEPGCENWQNCRYVVWGLGNSQWNAFLAFPRYVQQRLSDLGAQPLEPIGFGDVGSPTWEDGHRVWNDRVWPTLIELAGAQPSEAAAARIAAEQAAEAELTATDSNSAMLLSLDGQVVAPSILTNAVGIPTTSVRAVVCEELQAPESGSRTRHLEVSLPPGFDYKAGDHLGVCPQNHEDLVERLAARIGAALDGIFIVPKSMSVRAVPKGVPLQVRNVLSCLVDITSAPSIPLLDLLLDKATDPEQRAKLQQIKDIILTPDGPPSPLRTAIRAGGYDVMELLDEFTTASINIFELLQVVQPLRPRYYSTSSSPRIHGTTVAHISVGGHVSEVAGMPHRRFRGMSSHYIHTRRVEDRINVFLDRAEGFHLQEDVNKPMIFVSAGTGYAPMRAFLFERLAMRREGVALGPAMLFNGIRSSRLDFIYREEIEMFVSEGVLDHLHIATSREEPGRREYVQDRITSQAAVVWQLIEDGAYIYVCGSEAMRASVREAFVQVAVTEGGMTHEAAEGYLDQLETVQDRYRPDVWG